MKTLRMIRKEEINKNNKQIWKSLGIDRIVKKYGLSAVKNAVGNWLKFQRINAKLSRRKVELERELNEIGKIIS